VQGFSILQGDIMVTESEPHTGGNEERMAFPQARTILKAGLPPLSTLKLLIMAAAGSRPRYRKVCLALLRPFTHHSEVAIHYFCHARRYVVLVRIADLESDWYSVNEIAVRKIYSIDPGFVPDLVIDGGGNTGLFTLFAAAAYPSAAIVTCEPVPRNLRQIEKHLRINGVTAEVQPVCIGGSERKIPFYVREANQGSFDPELPYSSRIDVGVVTLASLLRGRSAGRILIKLDIEGMEVEALESLVPGETRPIFVVGEVHNFQTNRAALERIFARSGWTVRFENADVMTSGFVAWSPAALPMLVDEPVAVAP
jgi:FkbM family methyltransferase